jgi:hypothetical protein
MSCQEGVVTGKGVGKYSLGLEAFGWQAQHMRKVEKLL